MFYLESSNGACFDTNATFAAEGLAATAIGTCLACYQSPRTLLFAGVTEATPSLDDSATTVVSTSVDASECNNATTSGIPGAPSLCASACCLILERRQFSLTLPGSGLPNDASSAVVTLNLTLPALNTSLGFNISVVLTQQNRTVISADVRSV